MDSTYREFADAAKAKGHKLYTTTDGEIDFDRVDGDCHNGPACELCGEGWCVWCESNRLDDIQPCQPDPSI